MLLSNPADAQTAFVEALKTTTKRRCSDKAAGPGCLFLQTLQIEGEVFEAGITPQYNSSASVSFRQPPRACLDEFRH